MDVSSPIVLACFPRVGAPPVRFKGWFVMRHQRPIAAGQDVFLELWQRQRGGFTATFSRWQDEEWKQDSISASALDDLMREIEVLCAELLTCFSATEGPVVGQLRQAACIQQQVSVFLHLAGHALDDWDKLRAGGESDAPLAVSNG